MPDYLAAVDGFLHGESQGQLWMEIQFARFAWLPSSPIQSPFQFSHHSMNDPIAGHPPHLFAGQQINKGHRGH